MEHPAVIHQPIGSNKLSCGWVAFAHEAIQPAGHAIAPGLKKIKVDQWRLNV
jgi:hypothetical protein